MAGSHQFALRALEIHSAYIWDFSWVRRALDLAQRHGLNALVLHQNDIVDRVVYPGALFEASRAARNVFERYAEIHRSLYTYTPLRRSEVYQHRDYIKRVIDVAGRAGIAVYFENKELCFPAVAAELNPQVFKRGALCPSEPFWWDLTTSKYRELLEDLPDLAGVIVSPGTRESHLSITSHRCPCEACAEMTAAHWYGELLSAMYEPLSLAGKRLVIRDFVFDKRAHDELARTVAGMPADVAISFKNTPHDYYPTFPDNPRIGTVGSREQWIEFDCMGQYFGWGIAPAIMIEDMRKRLQRARDRGVGGIMLRTDWESLNSHSAFHTPNLINLYAGATLSRDIEADAAGIYRTWLDEQNMLEPSADEAGKAEAAQWAMRVLSPSWGAVQRALFINDCVFSDSSSFPVSLGHAWWLGEEKNSLKDWRPEKADALKTDPDNVRAILDEKDAALGVVEGMLAAYGRERPGALTVEAYADLGIRLELARHYIEGFRWVGRACILAQYVVDHRDGSDAFSVEVNTLLEEALGELERLATEYRELAATTDRPHPYYILLSAERIEVLRKNLAGALAAAVPVTPMAEASPT